MQTSHSNQNIFPMGQAINPTSGYLMPKETIEQLLCLPPVQLVKLLLLENMAKSELYEFTQQMGLTNDFKRFRELREMVN